MVNYLDVSQIYDTNKYCLNYLNLFKNDVKILKVSPVLQRIAIYG